MLTPRVAAAFVLFFVAPACEPVEPAPEDLDGAFHWLWLHYDEGDTALVQEAVANLGAAADAAALAVQEPVDGSLSDITREEIDAVSMREDADPAVTAGMYLANAFPCTLARLEEIVIALDQGSLYDEAYETYLRTYDGGDAAPYLSRDEPILTWTSEITSEMLGSAYAETVRGQSRWLPAEGDAGDVLIARYWMPEEATFDNDDLSFTQDYQLEIYWERGDGTVAHLYGMWRHMAFLQADTDDEGFRRTILNNLGAWDERTAELCAE